MSTSYMFWTVVYIHSIKRWNVSNLVKQPNNFLFVKPSHKTENNSEWPWIAVC